MILGPQQTYQSIEYKRALRIKPMKIWPLIQFKSGKNIGEERQPFKTSAAGKIGPYLNYLSPKLRQNG